MKIIEKIKKLMPIEKIPSKISSKQFFNALLYVVENGCKRWHFPKNSVNWHTIFIKLNRWAKNRTIQRIFEDLQKQNIINVRGKVLCLYSTNIKIHPNAFRARKDK